MKNFLSFLAIIIILQSCNKSVIEKPENLISEDKMIEILYEVALYDAIKAINSKSLNERNINNKDYIYNRFNVDSLQVVNSNKYYASNIENYVKMFDKIEARLEQNKILSDSLAKNMPKETVKDTLNKQDSLPKLKVKIDRNKARERLNKILK